MGTRHLYWILTGFSFAVHTTSQKKYRQKYKQTSPYYNLEHFSVGKSLFYLPLTSRKCPKYCQNITLNLLVNLLPILLQIICLHIQNKYTQRLDFYVYLIRKFYIHKLLKQLTITYILDHGSNCSVFRTVIKAVKKTKNEEIDINALLDVNSYVPQELQNLSLPNN